MKKIKGLYHIHSKYSKYGHGKNTVEEMVAEAQRLGLEEIAITDHGYKHIFGIRKKFVQKQRAEIDSLKEKYDIKILMGLELNLLGNNGETDLTDDINEFLDIRLMGVHKAGRVSIKNFFAFILSNVFKKNNKARIEKNTDSYIKAIIENKIDIVTHPNEFIKINPYRLAKACSENNCYLELNNKHLTLLKSDIEEMLKTDVKFVISSDAHSVKNVLRVDNVVKFAEECNIPLERIVNINNLPNFEDKYPKEKQEEIIKEEN